MQHDYYQVLGVDPNANFEAIRNAYRQCALRYHPDRGGSHEQMIVINEAWEILSDPERRQRYDAVRLNTANPTVQAAAETDAQQAHQEAEQYPRRWADFEVWLDSVAKDFDKAEFKPGRWGFGILQLFPSAGGSRSGKLFVLLGAILGVTTFYVVPIRTFHWTAIEQHSSSIYSEPVVKPTPTPCTDTPEMCRQLDELKRISRMYQLGVTFDDPNSPKNESQYVNPYSFLIAFLTSVTFFALHLVKRFCPE